MDGHRGSTTLSFKLIYLHSCQIKLNLCREKEQKAKHIKRIILIATINPETINPETLNPMKIDESSMSESLMSKTLVN